MSNHHAKGSGSQASTSGSQQNCTRRAWLAGAASSLATLTTLRAIHGFDAQSAIDVGASRQLLVDDALISSRENLRRRLHQPQKANGGEPVLLLDRPWEQIGTPIVGGVLCEQGSPAPSAFQIWYRGGGGGPRGGIWCYAESRDGIHWRKPNLRLQEFQGSRDNNIYVVGQPQAFTPFVDPNEKDPSRRYKSAVNSLRIDTALAHSPDGLKWREYRGGAAITGRASDTLSQVLWDPFAKVYRLYTRTDYGTAATGEVRGTRDMQAAADSDLSNPASWRKVREWCLGWERGDKDYHRVRQLYSFNGWIHEGVQFGLIWALENGDGETMNAYLATTRGEQPWDLHWIYGDQPLLPRGEEGSFDCRWIQPATTIVTRDDKHWLYYAGLARSHDGRWSERIDGAQGGIGLATIRRDGFISLQAGVAGGRLTTRLIKLTGNRLAINARVEARGEIRAAIEDAEGRPLDGFGFGDCRPFRGDSVHAAIRWRNHTNMRTLMNKNVRLRFLIQNADLYAFQVDEA